MFKGVYMEYNDLNSEQKDIVKKMVSFCLNNGYCLGMSEGWNFDSDGEPNTPDEDREALTQFIKTEE